VGKVKEWLSLSSWASYFHSSERASTSQPAPVPPLSNTLPHRPLKFEAMASKNLKVCAEEEEDTIRVSGVSDTAKKPLGANIPKLNFNQRFKFSPNEPFNDLPMGSQSLDDQGECSDDSNVSWVAEADEQGADSASPIQANHLDDNETSRVAEDDEDYSKPSKMAVKNRVSRPNSIALAKKKLSGLESSVMADTPYTYVLGEGRATVASKSTFLVTPGAEVTVQCIANPMFVSRPPEVASAEGALGMVVSSGANMPLMASTATRVGHLCGPVNAKNALTLSPLPERGQDVVSLFVIRYLTPWNPREDVTRGGWTPLTFE